MVVYRSLAWLYNALSTDCATGGDSSEAERDVLDLSLLLPKKEKEDGDITVGVDQLDMQCQRINRTRKDILAIWSSV